MGHAICSPSSASRWIVCTRSARLEASLPERSSVYADEGTLAHKLGELLILRQLKRIGEQIYKIRLAVIMKGEYYSDAMMEYAQEYCAYVVGRYMRALKVDRNAILFIETELNLRKYVPEGYGTADVLIICKNYIEFIDLKYGQGVPVSAVENKQLMLYGLGAIELGELFFENITTLHLTIYQPRIDNINSWTIDAMVLEDWAENELKERARMAFEGEGEFVPGSHCQFCDAKAQCKAHAKFRMSLAKYAFKDPDLLDDEEIADILTKYQGFVSWAQDVHKWALTQAVAGKQWPGFKLVAGRSHRRIVNVKGAVSALKAAGYKPEEIYKKPVIRGIGELEALLG